MNKHHGSKFDTYLKEKGTFEEVKRLAQKHWGVTVPDLPGCFTVGDTIEDVLKQAREAIECHLEGLLLHGDPIPEPKTIASHQDNPDYAGGQWEAVAVIIPTDVSKIRMPQPNPIHRFFRWFNQAAQMDFKN